MNENEEGWTKPMKHAPITYFERNPIKATEKKNSNRNHGLSEDINIKNV